MDSQEDTRALKLDIYCNIFPHEGQALKQTKTGYKTHKNRRV